MKIGLDALLLGYAITAHPLAGIVQLVEDILGGDITGADDAHADGNGCSIATEPPPRCSEHG